MASDKTPWWRWQGIALGGLLVIVILSVSTASGVWLAALVGFPELVGWLVGLVIGLLMSRAMMRRLTERLMA